MPLLNGQSFAASCPYLWTFCTDGSCDGCSADKEQARGFAGAPWVQGTTAEERHYLIQQVANTGTVEELGALFDGDWSRRRA